MSKDEIWRWVEERKWAYRGMSKSDNLFAPLDQVPGEDQAYIPAFGFAASLLESIPIAGLFFSIPNRIGAAMM
jgi:hypothetical protein